MVVKVNFKLLDSVDLCHKGIFWVPIAQDSHELLLFN